MTTTAPLTLEKCNCGDPVCNKYRISAMGAANMIDEEDARRIVHRHNMHDDLVAALKDTLEEAKASLEAQGGCDHGVGICVCGLIRTIENAEFVLAAAQRKST